MDLAFKDKIVVITGSSAGIGKTTARVFCKEWARLIINSRNSSKLDAACNELQAQGYSVDFYAGDVTDYGVCKKMCDFILERYGRIDILITNGSVSMNARFDEIEPQVFREITDSNIYGAAMPARAFLSAIKASKGSILFIGSLAGIHGMPGASAYSVGKIGLRALQQSLEVELKGTGVHVGLVELGFTKNDPGKVLVTANGEWKAVPARLCYLQQSQEKVAGSILSAVKYRRRRRTLSFTGKILLVLNFICTPLLRSLLRSAH